MLRPEDRVSTYLLESRVDFLRETVMSGFDLSFRERSLDRDIRLQGGIKDALWIKFEENDPWQLNIKKKFGKDANEHLDEVRLVRPGKFITSKDNDEDDKDK